jgi:hypothetical protein
VRPPRSLAFPAFLETVEEGPAIGGYFSSAILSGPVSALKSSHSHASKAHRCVASWATQFARNRVSG